MLALGNHESRLLPIGSLNEPPNPSRTAMDEAKLDELVDNIKKHGVKSHLIVVPEGNAFEIIAGHRRFYAARRAGLVVVPCDIYPDRADADEAVQHAENRFREDLSATDEAIWFDDLLDRRYGGDVDKLCAALGEKRAYVEDRINLFRGDEQIFRALQAGEIKIGVAKLLNRVNEPMHRRMLLDNAVRNGATEAIVSGWVREWFQVHEPATRNVETPAPELARGPVMETNYFRCVLCGKSDAVHLMQPRNMHTYCEQAMFPDMLAFWEHRSDYIRRPRTEREAHMLIVQLAAEFPVDELDAPDETTHDPRRI